jgi:CheY-like chemotaxis protein
MAEGVSILVVDDQPEIRSALRRCLNVSGNTVHEAQSGEEALRVIEEHHIDLVVSDYDMPGMTGLELLQRIRLSEPKLRRILLTGRADVHVAARAINEGSVHRFLLKPWENYDLEGIVNLVARSGD